MPARGNGTRFIALLLLCQLGGSYVVAQPIKWDFSSGGTDWTSKVASFIGGVAALNEDMSSSRAYIERVFTIPELALSLSFEYRPVFAVPPEEAFSAFLLDGSGRDVLTGNPTGSPLIPTDADPADPFETYYFMHNWSSSLGVDEVITDPAYVTLTDLGSGWTEVTLDLRSLDGVATEAFIAFDFTPGFYDSGVENKIEIDNVRVAVVPAFSSVTLGVLGFGTVGVLRRRRRARHE